MKSNPTESPSSGDMPAARTGILEQRSRRTLAQAASQLARSMVKGKLGGSSLEGGGRGLSANSAAASVHRLRKVLERDRATFAAQDAEIPEASMVALAEHDEHVTARDRAHVGERTPVCKTCSAREHPVAAHMQASRALLHVPPPPPHRACVVTDRADGRASALAAAAASAFGSRSAGDSPGTH